MIAGHTCHLRHGRPAAGHGDVLHNRSDRHFEALWQGIYMGAEGECIAEPGGAPCSTHVLNAQQHMVCMSLVRATSVLNISLVCLTDMCTQAKMMGRKALEAAQVRALTFPSGLIDCTPSMLAVCCKARQRRSCHPSLRRRGNRGYPSTLRSLSSHTCGNCHSTG